MTLALLAINVSIGRGYMPSYWLTHWRFCPLCASQEYLPITQPLFCACFKSESVTMFEDVDVTITGVSSLGASHGAIFRHQWLYAGVQGEANIHRCLRGAQLVQN